MNDKKRYQKIFVNDECILDFTDETVNEEDIPCNRKYFNRKGELVKGTKKINLSYNSYMYEMDINLTNETTLDIPNIIADFYVPEHYIQYTIYINKESRISNDNCYASGVNYGYITFYCCENMSYSDVWNCIEEPSLDYLSNFISGIDHIEGVNRLEDLVLTLPNWEWIPRCCFDTLWDYNTDCAFNKVIIPSDVKYLESVPGTNILECLSETPPELGYDTIDCKVNYIVVPSGCKGEYTSAPNWCNLADIIYEVGEELPEEEY